MAKQDKVQSISNSQPTHALQLTPEQLTEFNSTGLWLYDDVGTLLGIAHDQVIRRQELDADHINDALGLLRFVECSVGQTEFFELDERGQSGLQQILRTTQGLLSS